MDRRNAMAAMSRRALINTSIGLAATATLARPYIANAQAKTATVWWIQGFAHEEDIAFKKLIEGYQKASGNKIDDSIIPYAPMRRKSFRRLPAAPFPTCSRIPLPKPMHYMLGTTSWSMSAT